MRHQGGCGIFYRKYVKMISTSNRSNFFLCQDDELAEQISNLRFLVLDEADRMIETGHFAELDNILRLTLRPNK